MQSKLNQSPPQTAIKISQSDIDSGIWRRPDIGNNSEHQAQHRKRKMPDSGTSGLRRQLLVAVTGSSKHIPDRETGEGTKTGAGSGTVQIVPIQS